MRAHRYALVARSLALLAVFASCKPGASTPERLEDGRPQLPALPDDLQPKLGRVYQAIKARHSAALPELSPAPATPQEHTAWVDGVLEPWRARGGEIGIALNEVRPSFPESSASDDEVAAYERLHLVYAALAATLSVDESIARITIPLPETLATNAEMRADLRKFGVITSKEMRQIYDLWRSSCEYAGGHEPTPNDLIVWQTYCFEMSDLLLVRTCDLERRLGIDAGGSACEMGQ